MIPTLPFASLSHFSVNQWDYDHYWTCNFSALPRPHYALTVITEKFCTLEVQGETMRVEKGEMFFVPEGARYLSFWTPGAQNITILFSFSPDTNFPGNRAFEIQKILPLYEGELCDLFRHAYQDAEKSGYNFSSLSRFFDVMHRIMPRIVFSEKKKQDERIERALVYIDAHYSENFTIAELAAEVQMSLPHFYAVFRDETGVSPIEYRNSVRIRHAIVSIMQGGKSIETIGEELGFASVTYFRRVFKKLTGCLPSKYNKIATDG